MTATTTRAAETWAHLIAEVDPMPVSIAADFARDDGSEPAEACAAVEAVAQQHLDAHPDDHKARRLLGEWLQWHGDERGEGYRALGVCGLRPTFAHGLCKWMWFPKRPSSPALALCISTYLPEDWYEKARPQQYTRAWNCYPTRRDAEDAASLAFARLPAERRAALLKGEM